MTDAIKAAETKEIKFKADLDAFSDRVKPLFATDAATGGVTLPDSHYFDLAPAGITPESYLLHKEYHDLHDNGVTKAATEVAVPMFVENKELQTVTVTAHIHGKDTYEAVLKRNGVSRNPGTGEVSNYVGSISVARSNIVSTRSKAESNNIKANFRALAESAGL